jgi:DNA repair exonuclease SbcCD ATPase subunit/predicted phosphodiesterase
MKNLKLIHISDIHFRGLKRHSEYKKIMSVFFDKSKTLEPDAFIIAGDIVHSKNQNITPELIEILTWWFSTMAEIAPVYVTLGNHDGLLTNLNRQDAITPIIKAINSQNIFLMKESGVYRILDNRLDLCVFSPFDEEGWQQVLSYEPSDAISVAVFHGAVGGSISDSNWQLESEVKTSFFDSFDYVFLGDIHKNQDLDTEGKISYPGSMIQQNFSESPDKGFLFWDIQSKDKFAKQFIELPGINPFITIDWDGSLESSIRHVDTEYLKNAKIRIKTPFHLSQTEARDVSKELRTKFGALEVCYKVNASDSARANAHQDIAIAQANREPSSLIKMMIDFGYLQEGDLSLQTKLIGPLKKAYDNLDQKEIVTGKTWSLNKLNFSNTYGYGADNFIDFSDLNGLVGIFGQNRVGKSSIPATILYSLFNDSDRGLTKNLDIINVRKDYCSANVEFSVDGNNFRVERQSIKKSAKNGDVSAITQLNFSEIDKDGEYKDDFSGEQRRDTDRELRRIIGTSEDFILTAFSTQGDHNNFISAGPTQRKEMIARFLQLDFFNSLYSYFRDESAGIRKKLLDDQIKFEAVDVNLLVENLRTLKLERENISNSLSECQHALDDYKNSGSYDLVKKEEARIKRNSLLEKIKETNAYIEKIQGSIQEITTSNSNTEEELERHKASIEALDISLLTSQKEVHRELNTNLTLQERDLQGKKNTLEDLKRSVSILKDVPCGDTFPGCKFIKESHKNKDRLVSQQSAIDEAAAIIKSTQKAIKHIRVDQIDAALQEHKELTKKISGLEKSISLNKLAISEKQNSLLSFHNNIDNIKKEISSLENKWDFNSESNEHEIAGQITKLTSLAAELSKKEKLISEKIGSTTQIVSQTRELAKSIDDLAQDVNVYDLLMQAFSKNGIPAQLVNVNLPIINQRLKDFLEEECGFDVILESEEDSKKLNIFIDYGDSKRKIECASGMEKMISSIALRTALHSITQLPKPDFMIIDEGFGSLDESNVEICLTMMRNALKNFRFILIISHVDSIKESIDIMIEVNRNELDSSVCHE